MMKQFGLFDTGVLMATKQLTEPHSLFVKGQLDQTDLYCRREQLP